MKGRHFDFRFAYLAFGLWIGSLAWFSYSTNSKHWLVLLFAGLLAIFRFVPNKRLFTICLIIGLSITSGRYLWLHHSDEEIKTLSNQNHFFTVTSDPQLVEERFSGSLNFKKDLYLYADLNDVGLYLPVALTVDQSDSNLAKAQPSSVWHCRMKLTASEGNRRYLAFANCLDEPKLIATENRMQSIAGIFRSALAELTYKTNRSAAAALLPGLVVGDNQAQSEGMVRNLRISGLGHLTAVSGANVAILLLFIQFLLQRTQLSDKWRFALLIAVLLAFVVVARPSPSVVRAAMMAAITLLFWIKGLQKLSEGILFLAISTLLVIDPWLAISWGFALSAAATLGLILLPRMWGVDETSSLFIKLGSTAFAATLATMPILFAMGSPVTFATVPANILAEFMVAPATVLGLIAPLVHFVPLLSVFAPFIANLAIGCSAAIVAIAKFFATSIFAINVFSSKGFLLMLLIAIAYKFRKNIKVIVGIVFIATLILLGISKFESRWFISNWEIAVCDIGQGDSTLIRTGEHSALVVDTGPESQLMKECLETFQINQIDMFVASHFHADHIGGISGLVDVAPPKRVITAQLNAPNSGVEIVEREIAPLKREVASLGMSGTFQTSNYFATWQVLAPASSPLVVDESNGSLINNNSVVLLITTKHHRVLLTGDIEVEGQDILMSSISNPNVDIVKVPHHGSAYQSPDFAGWAHANLAWISVAKENSYGHPNPTTILLYQTAGSQVLTTMDCGHISIGAKALSTSRPCV